MKLRPSIMMVRQRSSCFNPAVVTGTFYKGVLRDQFSLPVIKCDHLHETEDDAIPCAAELVRREYSDQA